MGPWPIQVDEKRRGPVTTLYAIIALSFVIPSVPGFPTSPLSPAAAYVVLPKENHMQLTEAATLDRKSGGAERICSSRTLPGNTKFTFKMNCHLDRSVPGFPATLHWKRPRVRLSVRKAA
jgi:hypothetical protein